MDKNVVRITESELKQMVEESVNRILTELDWKTYANASRKRYNQYRSNPQDVDKFNKGYELGQQANKSFKDQHVGDWEHDTLGDKLRGRKSATFDANINPRVDGERMAYGAVKGYNKNRDEIFSTDKNTYHTGMGGITTPGKHFRDKEIGDAFARANDEVWDYAKDNYEYQKGKGWSKKIDETRATKEPNYTHFAVNKKTNLIVNGWDYSDYDNSELRAFENDYFWDDMRDYEFNPKDYRILSRKGCLKLGINPDDMDNCWSNRGEIPCAQERMNK